jgi:hypothetical protein
MKGFGGPADLGICIEDVYVKGKLDSLNVAFSSKKETSLFREQVSKRIAEINEAMVRLWHMLEGCIVWLHPSFCAHLATLPQQLCCKIQTQSGALFIGASEL